MSRNIPGTIPVIGREFLYVQCADVSAFEAFFSQVGTIGSAPPPKKGGMLNESARLVLPDGRQVFAISFKGDLEGWRRKIYECASELGAVIGHVERDAIRLNSSERYSLSECQAYLG